MAEVLFNKDTIQNEEIKATFESLLALLDPLMAGIYIQKISNNLTLSQENLTQVTKLPEIKDFPIENKNFIINESLDPRISPEWINWFANYLKETDHMPSSVLKRLVELALTKNLNITDFSKIVRDSLNDGTLIESKISNYQISNNEETVSQDNSRELPQNKKTENDFYNTLLQVMSASRPNDITDIKNKGEEILAGFNSSTQLLNEYINNLYKIIDEQATEIKNTQLIAVTHKEINEQLKEENKRLNDDIEQLRQKIVQYEKNELSRVNLSHKLTEFAGLINEIDKNNIITLN